MISPFELAIKALVDLGFYGFVLPFFISAAVFYGLLRRSKFFGESNVLNAALSIALAFMVFGFPVITGQALGSTLVVFFTQITVFTLVFVMAFMLASLFYPDFETFLVREFKRRTWLWVMILLSVGVMVLSGLVSVIWSVFLAPGGGGGGPSAPRDVLILVGGLIVFVIAIAIAAGAVKKEEEK